MWPLNTLKMSSHTLYLLALPEKKKIVANSCKLGKINNQKTKEKREKNSPQLGIQREETLHFV